MVDSPRARYSRSPSPYKGNSRARSRSRGRSRSPRQTTQTRSRSGSHGRNEYDAANRGNTLYVTGLSSRVTERGLEDHFSKEGKVASCRLIVEPRTQISRGFAFVTMDTVEDADRCIKYLDQSVLEGRHITVERSRRGRPRTPTPGSYFGAKITRNSHQDRGRYNGRHSHDDYGSGYARSPRRSPYRSGQSGHDYFPRRSPYRTRRERPRSHSPYRSPVRGGYGYRR